MENVKLLIDMPGAGLAGDVIQVSPDRAARWIAKGFCSDPSDKPPSPEKEPEAKPQKGKGRGK